MFVMDGTQLPAARDDHYPRKASCERREEEGVEALGGENEGGGSA